MNSKEYENVRCRLYLYGVLGSVPKLLRSVPEARNVLGEAAFSICFSTRSGLKSTLAFADKNAQCFGAKDVPSDMGLYFVSDAQANRLFTQEGLAVPLPVRGILQMGKLKIFKNIMDILQSYLKPDAEQLNDAAFLEVHVSLLMGLALRSICEIGAHEAISRSFMSQCPDGLAAFYPGQDYEPAWISFEDGLYESGFGHPEKSPDVIVRFRDVRTALDALEDRLDVNASVGLGQITVEGLAPLADNLGYLMQRIPHYLS